MTTEAQVFCSQCGQGLQPAEALNVGGATVCAACKPVLIRRLQEGAPVATTVRYKGFWIRWVAKVLDAFLLDLVLAPLYFVFLLPTAFALGATPRGQMPAALPLAFFGKMALFELLALSLFVAYNTLMLGRFGTTVGKMAINAKVVTADGSPIRYGRALGRTLMEVVSAMVLWIGYIIAAFDDQKRTLHDRVAGTVVVAKQ